VSIEIAKTNSLSREPYLLKSKFEQTVYATSDAIMEKNITNEPLVK
jgi:hypothetical protein